MTTRRSLAHRLPDFPWDTIADFKATASAHPDGLVNLSVGTPVDDVDPQIRKALSSVSEVSGYPTTHGTVSLRQAAVDALSRRYNVTGLACESVVPVVGTKEAIAWLPTLLGLGSGDLIVIPERAYPTYEVSAIIAGADMLRADSLLQLGPETPSLVFINSPSNPTGKVLGVEHLQKVVEFARERDVIVVADECYIGLGWDDEKPPVSILDERVSGGDHTNLIAMHSLSKSSNLASYRAGFAAGDPTLIAELLEARKHAGLIVPLPVQAAMEEALNNDEQEAAQRARYQRRRDILLPAVKDAGFTVDDSEAGLYIWATRGENCRESLAWLAERGILVAPGDFYGPRGKNHVRIALTATDERIDAAARRLREE